MRYFYCHPSKLVMVGIGIYTKANSSCFPLCMTFKAFRTSRVNRMINIPTATARKVSYSLEAA